jgi:hypothetical protein
MSRMSATAALLLTLAVFPQGAVAQRQVPGTIRSGITIVPIDVRVVDRDGKPITDLKQEDFTIVEDGVTQTIRQFAAQALTPETAVPGARPPMRSSPGSDIGPLKHRTS